nr:hypothetical protein [uncultured Holophaga sp.]
MWSPDWRTSLLALPCLVLTAQSPQDAKVAHLQAGEALAIGTDAGAVELHGDCLREYPMGSLAKLVWLDMEGSDWEGLTYTCKGVDGPERCWLAKGHGRVDLEKALRGSCNLAFLQWARKSMAESERLLGPGATRALMEDTFQPFLGDRMPPGEGAPVMTQAWIGRGDLLRTTPEAMVRWLIEPRRSVLLSRCHRFLGVDFKEAGEWWIKTGTGAVEGDPEATSAWVAGGNRDVVVVLHLPRGRGKVEGEKRFRELMGLR